MCVGRGRAQQPRNMKTSACAKRGYMTSPSHSVNVKHHLSLYSRRTSMEYLRGRLANRLTTFSCEQIQSSKQLKKKQPSPLYHLIKYFKKDKVFEHPPYPATAAG